MDDLFQPISNLNGVGGKRTAALERLGIATPYDLLYHIPRSYLDFSDTVAIAAAQPGDECTIRVQLIQKLHPSTPAAARSSFGRWSQTASRKCTSSSITTATGSMPSGREKSICSTASSSVAAAVRKCWHRTFFRQTPPTASALLSPHHRYHLGVSLQAGTAGTENCQAESVR